MRAAIYARYSTDLQRAASIEDQQRIARDYAAREGWEVSDDCVFSDRALSGSVAHRPGYQDMVAAARSGTFDVLIADDVSRLGRDQEEQHRLVKRLRFWGVGLVAVADGVDTIRNPKSSALILGLKAAMGEEAVREIAERTRRGLAGRVRAGFSAGALPYGYRSEPVFDDPRQLDRHGQPVPVGYRRFIIAEEAQVVRRIFALYAQGWSSRRIAQALTAEGVPPPGARWRNRRAVAALTWGHTCIESGGRKHYGIINNPVYVGRVVWNKAEWRRDPESPRGRRVPRLRPEHEWIVTEAPELRVISDELWETTKTEQERRRAGRHYRGHYAGRHLLSGLLKCALCGGSLGMRGKTGYGCLTRAHRGKHLCANASVVNRRALETLVLEAVREQLFDDRAIADLIRVVREELMADPRFQAQDPERARDLHRQLAEKRAQVAGIVESLRNCRARDRAAAAEVLEGDLETLAREQRDLEQRVTARRLGAADGLAAALAQLPRFVRDYVDRLSERLAGATPGQGDLGLGDIIDEVVVSPPTGDRSHFLVVVRGALDGVLKLLPATSQTAVVAGADLLRSLIGRHGRYRLPVMTGLRAAEIERLAISAARAGSLPLSPRLPYDR